MGNAPASALLFSILLNAPVVPAPVLRAAYAAASDGSNDAQLALVIAREDAPADLVAQFAAANESTQKAAYLSRATRPAGVLDRQREKRANVLAAALQAGEPHPDVVRDALEAFEAKPTIALFRALKDAPATWFTPAQAAVLLTMWAKHVVPNQQQFVVPTDLIARLGPQEALTLLTQARPTWLACALTEFPLPLAGLTKELRERMLTAHGLMGLTNGGIGGAYAQFAAHALRYLPDTDRMALAEDLFKLAERRARTLVHYLDRAIPNRSKGPAPFAPQIRSWDLTPAAPPALSLDLATASLKQLTAHAAGSDPAALSDLVAFVALHPARVLADLAAVLLRNPALATADRHVLLAALIAVPPRTLPTLRNPQPRNLSAALADVDGVALFGHDPVTVGAWLTMFPEQVLTRHGWEPFGGRVQAPRWLRQWQDAHPAGRLGNLTGILTAVANLGMTEAEIRSLDLGVLTAACAVGAPSAATVTDQVAALLTAELGQDPARWAAFTALWPTFPGPFGELLDTCQVVGA